MASQFEIEAVNRSQLVDFFMEYWLVLLIGLIVLLLLIFFATAAFCWRISKEGRRSRSIPDRLPWDYEYPIIEGDNYLHETLGKLEYREEFEVDPKDLYLKQQLGGGHYGTVTEGILNMSGNKISVAVKEPKKSNEVEEASWKMLYDELKIMCAVGQHPNIVTLVGAITSSQNLCVIVEKCDNTDLHRFLRNNSQNVHHQYTNETIESIVARRTQPGYWNPNQRIKTATVLEYEQLNPSFFDRTSKVLTTSHLLSYAWQIARGMSYLSTIKCVHRDLAARNVLLTSSGVCKVSDFGMARNIVEKEYYKYRSHPRNYRLFRLKSHYPLPIRWLAPEAWLPGERATVQSDMWSFGIVLFEIFTFGQLPYQNLSDEQVQEMVPGNPNDNPPGGYRNRRPLHLHNQIYDLMDRCWKEIPAQRPLFEEAARLLEDHLSQSSRVFIKSVRANIQEERETQNQLAKLRSKKSRRIASLDGYQMPRIGPRVVSIEEKSNDTQEVKSPPDPFHVNMQPSTSKQSSSRYVNI